MPMSAGGTSAYESTVAEVMKPTNFCQPGKGRKRMTPTTKVRTMPTIGTRLEFSQCSGDQT